MVRLTLDRVLTVLILASAFVVVKHLLRRKRPQKIRLKLRASNVIPAKVKHLRAKHQLSRRNTASYRMARAREIIGEEELLTIEAEDQTGDQRTIVLSDIFGCGCQRSINVSRGERRVNFDETTCGREAFARGSHQKVIGFSFYVLEDTRKDRRVCENCYLGEAYEL